MHSTKKCSLANAEAKTFTVPAPCRVRNGHILESSTPSCPFALQHFMFFFENWR